MIIVPTRVCNTDTCNYCWVLKKDFEIKYFQDFSCSDFYEKAKLLSEKTNDFELRFFGWEPMLKFETIKKIIEYFHQNDSRFHFTINTNLTLIDEEKINFILKYDIKLIISCNGKILDHSTSRGISIKKTLDLYKNIKKITSKKIRHQINIVVDNNTASKIYENLEFIDQYLWATYINLLPVNYNGWTQIWLNNFKTWLKIVSEKLKNKELNIRFINKEIHNEVALFNSEFVIDSDGNVYASMVILETFFQDEKSKILITQLQKEENEIIKDLLFYDNEYNSIYSQYINTVLQKKFWEILKNDYQSSEIFHQFLLTID